MKALVLRIIMIRVQSHIVLDKWDIQVEFCSYFTKILYIEL